LGGVKVSSEQLSEWGSYGGRPRKYNSRVDKLEARRIQRAIRLGKDPNTLRNYGVIETKTLTTQKGRINYIDENKQFPISFSGQCNKCGVWIFGGASALGSECQTCHQGVYGIEIKTQTITAKRAKTRAEINREYYQRKKQRE